MAAPRPGCAGWPRPHPPSPPSFVTIECRATSHEPKIARVGTFAVRLDDAGRSYVDLLPAGDHQGDVHLVVAHAPAATEQAAAQRKQAIVDADEAMLDRLAGQPVPLRWRYRLRCPLCGLDVTARRDGPLGALVEKLTAAGVSRLDLSALGRMLT